MKIDLIILDLDGTLYQLDGGNNGFSGSTLERAVNNGAMLFIRDREGCDEARAKEIFEEGLRVEAGLSVYLSRRYEISREDYFDEVWDINPEGVVKNFDKAVEIMRKLKRRNPDKKIILLTSAPRIWADRVLDYLGIRNCFELIITGEQYSAKSEVFEMFGNRYDSGRIISVGDQIKTDIKPAERMRMKTLWIQNPEDIKKLLELE